MKTLRLKCCSIKQMPPLDPVKGNLEVLRLRYNSLTFIPWDYFQGFTRLKEVDLTSNEIYTLLGLNQIAETLAILAIENNQLTSVGLSSMNVTFSRLYRLNVGKNNITTLSWEILRHFRWLYFFYVNENLLETVDDLSGVMHGRKTSVSLKYIEGSIQKRRNFCVLAMELRLFGIDLLIST